MCRTHLQQIKLVTAEVDFINTDLRKSELLGEISLTKKTDKIYHKLHIRLHSCVGQIKIVYGNWECRIYSNPAPADVTSLSHITAELLSLTSSSALLQ